MITSPFTLSQYTQAKEWRLNNDIDRILDHDVSILTSWIVNSVLWTPSSKELEVHFAYQASFAYYQNV